MGTMNRQSDSAEDQDFLQEAHRLAQLPRRQRKEAIGVHWTIANDDRFSPATRKHARFVAETLERLLEEAQKPGK